jgi:hypothetical protein
LGAALPFRTGDADLIGPGDVEDRSHAEEVDGISIDVSSLLRRRSSTLILDADPLILISDEALFA